ncbi:MAG: hypothetical protein LC720_03290, partial [Actinobacteria bacterium]|nr:hypothetical protein [Actinomycetota bacterium]
LDFETAVDGADRMTVAVTLYALLELYKQGEATWIQGEPFGAITIRPPEPGSVGPLPAPAVSRSG